eukprot:TRINITY_DN5923_c0_g1_i13.p1 TRINITY_DN5923_c0_g1~~TRINITY_DN5923_c0_g1_i13.p1  ORF type:complete len:209 (+),score=60.16 TRINITY_DN5923_c0_g1_i13:530-1156(+)
MKHHFDTVIQENAEIEHTKQSQRNKQKQDDILLNIEYGKRLEKEEKNRQAQYAAIYERGNRLGAMQGETYKEIDNVKAAEEAAFMKRLDELERIEKQRETDAASKRHVDRLEYRAALDSQVEHKDVLKHQAQLSVQQEREVMLREIDAANSVEHQKQTEHTQRQNQYLRDIQAQMEQADGSFPGGFVKSRGDGVFHMSETERRINQIY